jgi:hypothetical protein
LAEAIGLVEAKCDSDGRWPLDYQHPGTMPVELDEGIGQASRWNTLRALRVLGWCGMRVGRMLRCVEALTLRAQLASRRAPAPAWTCEGAGH